MAGLFSPRSGRGHFRGGLAEAAWEGRLSSRSPSLSDSRSIPRGLTQPGRPTDIAPHPPSLRCQAQGTEPPSAGQWAGHSFPATSPFAPRAAQAGLDWAGGSRSQHSRGAQGSQAPGIGVGKRLTHPCPEASYQEQEGHAGVLELSEHTCVMNTHTHTIHTHTLSLSQMHAESHESPLSL